jgi:D-alanyl-D-alanine endopeptidase (penicillin-binding protein 7)
VKKLLAYLICAMLVGAAPAAWSGTHSTTAKKHHAGKTVKKTHAKVKSGKRKVAAAPVKRIKATNQQRLKADISAHGSGQVVRISWSDPARQAEAQMQNLRMDTSLDGVIRIEPSAPTPAPMPQADAYMGGNLELHSAAVLVVDQATGEALYSKNQNVATPIASITKLMTSMVVLDAGLSMYEPIQINDEDVDHLKHTGSRLALGTELTREELLNLALIASENRAAAALSRAYPGGRPAFIRAMNRKAVVLGMESTRFVDSTGLNSDNRSTASDLVKLVNAAYNYPAIRRISSTGQFGVYVPGNKLVRVKENGRVHKISLPTMRHVAFNNTNALTRSPDWEIGVSKTGYISEAGHCLVMQAKIANRPVVVVLLDSLGKWSRIGDAARVRKWLEHQQFNRIAQFKARDPA